MRSKLTKGAVELRRRRIAAGHTQSQTATLVQKRQATVSRWEDGTMTPRPAERAFLEALYGVAPYWWERDDVRRRIDEQLKAGLGSIKAAPRGPRKR